MAKLFFPFGLVPVLLGVLLRTVSAQVTLNQLFVVQRGANDGGCDRYFDQTTHTGTLDDWLDEINFSVAAAIDAIDQYDQDVRVRRAIQAFFGIRNQGRASANTRAKVQKISDNLKFVQEFFSFEQRNGVPVYPLNNDRWLFCDSKFIVKHALTDPALDYLAHDIVDTQGHPVTIQQVPEYAAALGRDPNNEPWWSGDLTPINGYYFSDIGGNYCDDTNLGLTAIINELRPNAATRQPITSVIICDYAFNDPNRPVSYQAGDAQIVAGTNLATVVPRSATLFHEAFHVLFGVDNGADPNNPTGFLESDEEYRLGEAIEWAQTAPERLAQRNPENYVFFVTHMYYLFGDAADGITTNWDFAAIGVGTNRVWGARAP